ncbi:hypothetical protein [Bacillus sp. AG4(2022)]|uniref:hypothetical protein n=1 Tax=Bacillus sp. AG4(2022) TaxID=2962594 RepID=UPI00288270ED|nr:hypothetical protein [Bacillus sp. AG4(2022)]MDT0160657.1 hypothetical protein [Bacillus sp. AG4(2022)]
MKNFFQKAGGILKDKNISIPITSGMFSWMLESQTEKIESEGLYNIEVVFRDNHIRITGTAKKLLLKIPFSIVLTPSSAEKRIIKFDTGSMTPLNHDWIKKKIFNNPPYVNFENDLLHINLNGFEKVRAIPVGQILDFKIEDDKMWVRLGL